MNTDLTATSQDVVFQTLNRGRPIEALEALLLALNDHPPRLDVSRVAIGLDANVFLRIANHKHSSDIIDYLSGKHNAPLILPGQAVQEFWNNQMQAVSTIADSLNADFTKLERTVNRLDENFGSFTADMTRLLDEFKADHGSVYDAATLRTTKKLLEALKERADVPFVERSKFQVLAEHRSRTNTPPGFKDKGDGDFFIWADFLFGTHLAMASGAACSGCVLVTNDKKPDWLREGIPHPILSAEAKAVVSVPFEIWSLNQFAEKIKEAF